MRATFVFDSTVHSLEQFGGIFDGAIVAQEKPVDRTWSGVPGRTRVDDQSHNVLVDLFRNEGGQERTNDKVGLAQCDGLKHDAVGKGILDCHLMRSRKGEIQPLRERVVCCAKEEDLHAGCENLLIRDVLSLVIVFG